MSCEQMDARMVDFLYGELSVEERATFEAHLSGCPRCQQEVEAFAGVRRLTSALHDEAPPARAHAAILRAAQEALQARPAPAPVTPPPSRTPTPAPAGRASFWDWVRARWAFPTLATVGALSVFLLASRLFLDPQRTFQRARPAESSAPSEPPAPPAAGVRAPASLASPVAAPEITASKGGGLATAAPARAPGGAVRKRSFAAPPPARMAADDPALGGLSDRAGAPEKRRRDAPAEREIAQERAQTNATSRAEEIGATGAPESAKVSAKESAKDSVKKSKSAVADQAAEIDGAASERAPGGDRQLKRGRPLNRALNDDGDVGGAVAVPADKMVAKPAPAASAASRPAASAARARAAALPAESDLSETQAAPSTGGSGAGAARPSAGVPAPAAETAVERADRLFAERRWIEASTAYHELLRQNPTAADAPRWRQRMRAAQATAAASASPPGR